MIKNTILALMALVVLSSCQEQKIGFIDNAEVINEYQEKKDVEEKFKSKNETYSKKRDSISMAFQLEYSAFQNKKQSAAQKREQEGILNQKAQFLQQQLQIEQQQLQQQFNTEIDSVITKVKRFVEDYGKTNGYTYILGKNEAGSVMFGKEENDITKVILENLNKDYKKGEDTESDKKTE